MYLNVIKYVGFEGKEIQASFIDVDNVASLKARFQTIP